LWFQSAVTHINHENRLGATNVDHCTEIKTPIKSIKQSDTTVLTLMMKTRILDEKARYKSHSYEKTQSYALQKIFSLKLHVLAF